MSMFTLFPVRRNTAAGPRRRSASRVSIRWSLVEQLEPRLMLAVTVPPSISADVIEIDNNMQVADGSWDVTATDGHVQIFGNSKGRIDGTAGQSNEDLLLSAQSYITVTGAIGSSRSVWPFSSSPGIRSIGLPPRGKTG